MVSLRVAALIALVAGCAAQGPLIGMPPVGGMMMSPKICTTGACNWYCAGNNMKCRGLYYCGPATTSCKMTCPKGGCNDEIALISHCPGATTVDCVGEAVCTKMLLNCGNVSPQYIYDLNNLPGTLQQLFENMPPMLFKNVRLQKPFGECKLNCGFKSCKDLHMICEGAFARGKGCSMSAQLTHSFKDSFLHCAVGGPQTHCQANCGAGNPAPGSQVPGAAAALHAYQQYQGGEPACMNSEYNCFYGQCYCAGGGCYGVDFQRNGQIRAGFAPVVLPKFVPGKSAKKAAKKAAAKKSAQPRRRWWPRILQPGQSWQTLPKNKPPAAGQPAAKITRPKRPFYHYKNEPIKPDFLIGRFTHLICMTTDCKVECENVRSCTPLTIVAGPAVEKLVVECAEEACIGLNVESQARENDFKCINHGACAAASFTCGKPPRTTASGQPQSRPAQPFAPPAPLPIERCKVECQNGGCSKHNNPAQGMVKLQGVSVTCHADVLLCQMAADSASSRYNFPPQTGFIMPGVPANFGQAQNHPLAPAGSFEGGNFNCFVQKFLQVPGVRSQPTLPKCVLQCSTNLYKRYCGGTNYRCAASPMQCFCEDYCTGHPAECLANPAITKDCPRLQFPLPKPTTTAATKKASTKPADVPPSPAKTTKV